VNLRPRASRNAPVLPDWTRFWLTDSAVLLASQALTMVATSVAAVLIARQLDPREWGVFAGFLGLSVALSIVVQFGMSAWLLRELSRQFADEAEGGDATESHLLNSALLVNAALAVVTLVAGAVAAELWHLERDVEVALLSLLAYGGLAAASTLFEADLRARRRLGRVAAANFLEKYLLLSIVASIAALHGSVALIGLAYVGAGLVRLAVVQRGVGDRVRGGSRASAPAWRLVPHVVRGSFPFALTDGCLNVVPKLDTLLLLSLSATSAGFFALGDRILGPPLVLQSVLSITLFPFFARKGEQRLHAWLLAAVLAVVGALAAVILFVTAPALVPFLFGEKYVDAVPAVRVFSLTLPLVFASGPLRVFAFSRYREGRVVAVVFIASIAGTAAIVTGQWAYGVVAAAGGYVLRHVFFLAGLVWICAKAREAGSRGEAAQVRAAAVEVVP
jgi:O-antigen/teichoic acid export membrane protein